MRGFLITFGWAVFKSTYKAMHLHFQMLIHVVPKLSAVIVLEDINWWVRMHTIVAEAQLAKDDKVAIQTLEHAAVGIPVVAPPFLIANLLNRFMIMRTGFLYT